MQKIKPVTTVQKFIITFNWFLNAVECKKDGDNALCGVPPFNKASCPTNIAAAVNCPSLCDICPCKYFFHDVYKLLWIWIVYFKAKIILRNSFFADSNKIKYPKKMKLDIIVKIIYALVWCIGVGIDFVKPLTVWS